MVNRKKNPFTLVELLVVMSILAILMSLFVPALRSTMYKAKNLKCLTDKKSLAQATVMYCDDNDGYYPRRDKGALISGRYPGRVRVSNSFLKNTLYNTIGPYLSGGATDPTMTCALYKGTGFNTSFWPPDGGPKVWCSAGGKLGCLLHGAIHTKGSSEYFESTLNFYGGLSAFKDGNSGKYYTPLKNREKLGDPYMLMINNDIHALNILWGDVVKPFGQYNMCHPMYHEPPPGSVYEFDASHGEEGGLLRVYSIGGGGMGINYSYDDGSAKSIQLPVVPIKYPKEEYYIGWHINKNGNNHTLYPKE